MKPICKAVFICIGVVALFFGLLPIVIYGYFNLGVLVLLMAGAAFLLLPLLWDRLDTPEKPRPYWRKLRRIAAAVLSLALVAEIAFSGVMLFFIVGNAPPSGADVTIVVLGCAVRGDQPSLMLRYRLEKALTELEDYPDAPVVVSGGQGNGENISEAQAMYNWLVNHGVSPEQIYREDQSTNTRENLEFSAQVIDTEQLPRRVLVVSDGFHLLRGAIYARRAGLDEVYTAGGKTPWGLLPSYWIREQLAVMQAVLGL